MTVYKKKKINVCKLKISPDLTDGKNFLFKWDMKESKF